MNTPPRLECRGLGKIFNSGKEPPITALDNISFSLEEGSITGILGPDGAGKSTLLRLIAGLMKPTSGSLLIEGCDRRRDTSHATNSFGYMPQKFGLYEDLTVQENLDLYARLHDISAEQKKTRLERLLNITDLQRFTSRLAGKLSGGMKQKLALVCTLIASPRLLLLDEPTVGVDPLSRREIWNILRQMTEEERLSVLVSTAYMDEADYCRDTLILYKGNILRKGSPAEIADIAGSQTFIIHPPENSSLKSRQIQSELYRIPEVINASLCPEGVRLVISPESPAFSQLTEWNPRPAKSTFSDGFMTLLFEYLHGAKEEKQIAEKDNVAAPEFSTGALAPVSARGEENSDTALVEVRHLVKKFGSFTAVNDVSFSVKRGEIFGLLGPNGAGKSTTFYMLCGLLPPSAGTLIVSGVDLRKSAPHARRKIGYMAQKFSQYGNLTLKQNLEFSAGAYGMRGDYKKQRIADTLEEFHLNAWANHAAGKLPGGYKQRLGLACALLHQPDILFLDEPTSGADPLARREFWLRIGALADKGVTVIITTHFMDEAEYCDHIIIMMDGQNLAQGSPQEIREKLHTPDSPTISLEEAFIAITEKHRSSQTTS